MPFLFDLALPELTAQMGRGIEQAVADAAAWPVRYRPARRRRRWLRLIDDDAGLSLLTADPAGHVLADPGRPVTERWVLRAGAQRRLGETLLAIAREHRSPFLFRATWTGVAFNTEEELTANELAALIAVDALNPKTRYRVWTPLPLRGARYRGGDVPS